MKKITALFGILSGAFLFAQGIKFEAPATFQSLLAKAKQENKLIFMDAYAVWCGPCKLMDKNVFTKEEVGSYYNATFINTKIDMEKGEGVDIAKKYGVRAYPTYLFLNGDGELVYTMTGYIDVPEFIDAGKEAADPSKQVAVLKKKFDAGEKDPEFLKKIISVFRFSDPELAEKAGVRYFEGIKNQSFSQEDLGLLFGLVKDSSSPLYSLVVDKKTDILKFIPEANYNTMVKNFKLNSIMKVAYDKTTKKLDDAQFLAEADKVVSKDEAKELLTKTKMNLALRNKEIDAYQKYATDYYGDGKATHFSSNELNTVAWNFFEKVEDKAALKKAVAWAQEGVKKGENYAICDTVANLYFKLGDKKNAKSWAEKAISLAKKEGEDYKDTQAILDKL